ncbi:DgyrCDS14434 [Dimorphilus gyrociliatus]|uniref:DgyrCDS14434 n=1 Tax=Dimorphilus gyrociliatus TaxID=2664684 RepID=A0A7I8WDJ9_9ANNE|nr:DgyrCDS14434 [Dimorphilus gyrociliatus]
MNFFIIALLLTLAYQYSRSATVPNNDVYNCEVGQSRTRTTTCGICSSGRIPSSDQLKCFECPKFCSKGKCSLKTDVSNENDATICSQCIDNYFLDSGKCSECSTGCRNCTSATACLDCYSNYAINDVTKQCIPCPSNCVKCSWNSLTSKADCKSCEDRFVKKDTGCISCLSYCKSCSYNKDTGVSCSSCDTNAYKETINNINTCKLCSTAISGCKKCVDKDTCTECISKAYALSSSKKCEKCSSIHSACVECDASNGINKCKTCKSDYYLKDGSCSACPRNCDTCQETNNIVKCTKCKVDYSVVDPKRCDRCPENCLECQVSGSKLVCKSGRCASKYALNSDNLCSKCPDNCNACSWSSSNSRTECSGTDASHSCVENEGGKSWGRKSDGKCIACPGNCLKCYFKSSSASSPICYASKCQKGFAFDDDTGSCVSCPSGCDYCKKRGSILTCLKCSEKYAPKYNANSGAIDSCMSCSISNCDYCEVIGDKVECRRSPCASKAVNSNNKKFSFSSKTCATSCPTDSMCAAKKVNDENEACFCRSCPSGSVVILAGINAGVCKNCGTDCEDCQLTADKRDVECKTCKGSKQFVSVEVGGSMIKGCYDCDIARPQCKTFQLDGSTCRCKSGECIGDITLSPFITVLQETTGSQRCKACAEAIPNSFFCQGTYASSVISLCKYPYLPFDEVTCSPIVTGCKKSIISPSLPFGQIGCFECTKGYYLESVNCISCPSGCSDCIKPTGQPIICIACTDPTKSGIDCKTPTSTCTSPVPNCDTKWATVVDPATDGDCKCIKCSATFAIGTAVPNTGDQIGDCVAASPATPITDCEQHFNGASLECKRCINDKILDANVCHPGIIGCKENYSASDPMGGPVRCAFSDTNKILASHLTTLVTVAPEARATSNCIIYYPTQPMPTPANAGRCSNCNPGYILDFSPTKYDCIACTVASLDHCAYAVSSGGVCMCGRCTADGAGKVYHKHPILTGCTQNDEIPNCATHTLKLKNGDYIVACAECTAPNILAEDGLSCIACSKPCTGGMKVVAAGSTTCTCNCDAVGFLNSNGDDCISCTTAGKTGCSEVHLNGATCECKTCNANFVLNADKSACVACNTGPGGATANCKNCNLATSPVNQVSACSDCDSGYALLTSSTPGTNPSCMQCGTGCTTCTIDTSGASATTDNKCSVCSSGYTLNNIGLCIQCPQSPEVCSDCRIDPDDQTRALCLTFGCQSGGLRDIDFKCDTCTSLTGCDICIKQIGENLKCLKCNSGYYMDNSDACQQCQSGCDFCLDGTTCIPNGCNEGYIRHRTEGTCILCTGSGVSRCAYQTPTTDTLIPKICRTGYKLNSAISPATCEKCDPNCKSCETNGKDKCDSGQCNSGYFLDSSNQKCYKNKVGCLTSVRSNEKIICSSCNTATSILLNGECKTCPTGCSGCSFDAATNKFTCSSCIGKYYKTSDNLCSPCPTGCSVCSLNGASVECTSCLATYGLKGSLCQLCGIGECQTCSVPSSESGLVCLTCSNKFYLNSNDCGHCPKFCKECSYNQKYKCTKCYNRYAKASDGTCVPCPSNCETCTANADKTTRCTKCISNTYSLKHDGTCLLCSDAAFANCATCGPTPSSGKAKCHSCSGGFTLQDDELACLPCSITGCELCAHGQTCSKCKSGFYLFNFNRECARKCFECKGNKADCGNDLSGIQNSTDKVKVIDCGIGDCWAYRTEVSGTITFARGCSNKTCTLSNENENCKTIEGNKECKKCCKGEKCNTWALDGKAGVVRLVSTTTLLVLCNAFIFWARMAKL